MEEAAAHHPLRGGDDDDEDQLDIPQSILDKPHLLHSFKTLMALIPEGVRITVEHVETLVLSGFLTKDQITRATVFQLAKQCGFNKKVAKRIKTKLVPSCISSAGFRTATEVHDELIERRKLSSGSSDIDEVLGGGFESHSITEISGLAGSGKTQLCHMLAVNAQQEENVGGLSKKVIFIDTEGTFRTSRVKDMCQRYPVNFSTVAANLQVASAKSTDHLKELLVFAAALFQSNEYGVLIVDSVIHLIRREFVQGLGELAVRQRTLLEIVGSCKKLAEEFGLVVILTNQMRAEFGDSAEKDTPTGGNIMAHHCTTRILLRRLESGSRIFSLTKSPSRPVAEVRFKISADGISNDNPFTDFEVENTD